VRAIGWLNAGLLVWLVALPVFLYTLGGTVWVAVYHAGPPVVTLVALLVLAGLVIGLGTVWRARSCNASIAVVLGAVYATVHAQPLGDHDIWLRAARHNALGASELLASVVYRLVFLAGGEPAMNYVAPVCGVVFAYLFLSLCDRLFVDGAGRDADLTKKLCSLSFLAVSWHLLFATGYIENPQLSLPFLVLAIGAWSRYRTAAAPRRQLLIGSAWLAVACLFHGQNVALLPALPLLVWLCAPSERSRAQRAADLARGAAVFAGIVAAVLGLLWISPFWIHTGHVSKWIFLPPVSVQGIDYALFDAAHFSLVANVLLLASPIVYALPGLLVIPLARRSLLSAPRAHPELLILALGYCGFAFFVYFQLGFPTDFDLMLSLAVPLHLYLLRSLVAWAAHGRAAAVTSIAVLLAGAVGSWSVVSALLLP